jgi:hypothetical protein
MMVAQDNPTAVAQDALYVYCVARGDDCCLLGPIGLNGQTVYTVGSGGIRAIVHNCPGRPYQSDDSQVLEGWVVAHQNVVRAATQAFGTVLPMAFDVIVRGGAGGGAGVALKSWLDGKRERFTQLLQRLAGKAEFGVQVLWNRQAVAASLVESDDELRNIQEDARVKSRGMAHLLQQKLARGIRVKMEAQADLLARDFYGRIRGCVDEVRVEKLKKDDGGQQMLLNLSCLMPDGGQDLGHALDGIQKTAGVCVRFTGPWPPYSFVGG